MEINEKILVTGATGFIGSRLASRLINLGFDVHITARESSNFWRIDSFKRKLNIHKVDLENKQQVEKLLNNIKPDVIFHLACYGGFVCETDELCALNVNTLGTYYLLRASANVKKFIYIGSSSEYGVHNHVLTEDDLERPINIYGVSKLAASNLVRLFGENDRLPTMVLRVFSPYGIYDDPRRLIPSVIKACIQENNFPLGSGKQLRDFIYVEDLIDAFILAMQTSIAKGEIINLGSGKEISVKEVVNLIIEEFNNKYGAIAMQPIWNALSDRENEPKTWRSDNSKANKLLEWYPSTSLRDGLRHTISWMENINID